MCVECRVESLVLEDDDEDMPNGRHWSATLLSECMRSGGSDCGARQRGGEKASLTGTHHETKGWLGYPTIMKLTGGLLPDRRRSQLHKRIRKHAFGAPSTLHRI